MTIQQIAELQQTDPSTQFNTFKRPHHGIPYCFRQGSLVEACPGTFFPRLTSVDLAAEDWDFIEA